MALKLSFRDNSEHESGFHVYRSDTPMDPRNLPQPYKDLGRNSSVVIDEDFGGIFDQRRYYRVAAYVKGGNRSVSEEAHAGYDGKSPTLNLNFASLQYAVAQGIGLDLSPRAFSDLITFTRSSGGGRFNAQGQYEWLPANQPRIDYDPVTGEAKGLLIEEQRTRLNLISAAPIAPQTVTVGASAQTISFFGSGSVDLTGAHTATLLGSGPFPARRTYTFTPSAGSLTITPTGDVRMLQVEAGAFATSPIVGEGAQVTRAADVASVNVLSPWFNASEGTLFVEASTFAATAVAGGIPAPYYAALQNAGSTELVAMYRSGTTARGGLYVVKGGAQVIDQNAGQVIQPVSATRVAVSIGPSAVQMYVNGEIVASAIAQPPAVDRLVLGGRVGAPRALNGHIRSVKYYPRRLSDDQLQAMTA